jgi:hypothetical protein
VETPEWLRHHEKAWLGEPKPDQEKAWLGERKPAPDVEYWRKRDAQAEQRYRDLQDLGYPAWRPQGGGNGGP